MYLFLFFCFVFCFVLFLHCTHACYHQNDLSCLYAIHYFCLFFFIVPYLLVYAVDLCLGTYSRCPLFKKTCVFVFPGSLCSVGLCIVSSLLCKICGVCLEQPSSFCHVSLFSLIIRKKKSSAAQLLRVYPNADM